MTDPLTHERLLRDRWIPCTEDEARRIEAYMALWRSMEDQWGPVTHEGPVTRRRDTSAQPIKPILKSKEVASLLNVPLRTVHRWCSRDGLPCEKLGRGGELAKPMTVIAVADLLPWLVARPWILLRPKKKRASRE